MKLLLLLFMLFPAILFGQMPRKAMVDSINAEASDLQRISKLISNNRGTKVARISVSDSGEYVTMVVRIHVDEATVITPLPPLPITKIETGNIVADMVSMVTVPPPSARIVDGDTIIALSLCAVVEFNIEDITFVKADVVTVPLLAEFIVPEMIADLPVLAASLFRIEDIVIDKADTSAVPLQANALPGTIDSVPVIAARLFRIEDFFVRKADTADVPALADIELEMIEDLSLYAAAKLPIENRQPDKIDTVTVPDFKEWEMDVTQMHLSDEGYSLLEKLEGFSPMPYALKDGGLTIGFGFFVPYGEGSMWKKGMTWEEAEQIIRQKMPVYEGQVKQYINVPLTQSEFDALTMLAYNLGGFSKATSIVNDVNRLENLDKLQSDWKRFVHSKAPGVMKGLLNRRKDELEVRNESNYQPERKIQILKNTK